MIFGVVAWCVMLGDLDGMFDFRGGGVVRHSGGRDWGV